MERHAEHQVVLSVVAPVYNEEDVIEKVVRGWFEVLRRRENSYEVVLGDGGSTDRTIEILQQLSKEFPQLKIVQVGAPGGYGSALFGAVYASRGNYVVMLDSDGQFDLADYERLLNKMRQDDLDVVTGYRIKKRDSFVRVYADRILNLIVRAMFGLHQIDTNCAMKVFKGCFIRSIGIEARAWPTPTEIMIRLKALGCKVGEVGIIHHQREGGQSKLNVIRTSFEMLSFLFYMRFKLLLIQLEIIKNLETDLTDFCG